MSSIDLLNFGAHRSIEVILQTEHSECGLACIAMICSHYGYQVSLSELRERFVIDNTGTNLSELMNLAAQLELNPRAIKASLEEVHNIQKPAIIHWNLNHFVVLTSSKGNTFSIIDPVRGEIKLTKNEFSQNFTGIALELEPTKSFVKRKKLQSVTFGSLFGSVNGLWAAGIKILIISLLVEATILLAPQHFRILLDKSIPNGDSNLITLLGFIFLGILITRIISESFRKWMILWTGTNFNISWTSGVFRHLVSLPIDYFKKRSFGDITSRFQSITVIQETLSANFIIVIIDGFMAIMIISFLLYYNTTLALIVIGFSIAYFLLKQAQFKSYQSLNLAGINLDAAQQSKLIETIRTVQPLKLFNKEHLQSSQYLNLTADVLNMKIKTQKMEMVYESANLLITGGHRLLVLWIGATLVINSSITTGVLVVFYIYADMFLQRTIKLSDFIVQFRMLRLQLERLSDILMTNSEAYLEPEKGEEIIDNSLSLDNITFRYTSNGAPILDNISFNIEPGEILAITGPSGSGKSTIARIALGLVDPEIGEVRVGTRKITDIGKRRLRSLVGSVFQDDQLVAGTVAENISFFDDFSDRESIYLAAKRANIHDEINSMTLGYNTVIGDAGDTLSGGQKQRILIARAFYRKPKFLVLDEATSFLDSENELAICNSVKALKMTTLIIAHRTQTLDSADRVITVRSGRLVNKSD